MKPTQETYTELQNAYDFFNKALFESQLPECLIALQREKRTFGYYSPRRFANKEKRCTDEIAMNPTYFSIRTIEETLSTLVHEMIHLWQETFGKPGRGRYHNKQWADKMELIGLMPSSTGREGGKRTGDCMSHYIMSRGTFAVACEKLLTERFQISWADRFPPRRAVTTLSPGVTDDDGHATTSAIESELSSWGIDLGELPESKTPTRVKFSCPSCNSSAWGKPSLNIRCGDCDEAFYADD